MSRFPLYLFRNRRRRWIAAGTVALVALAVLAALWRFIAETPEGKPGGHAWVNISAGSSTAQIARSLETHHVIANGFWFRVYLLVTGAGRDLQAGDYRFRTGMTLSQVVTELRQGAVAYDTIRVTIPEGFTVRAIARLLADDGVTTTAAFLREVQRGQFSYAFIKRIPRVNNLKERLEGYLFPDTYDFLRGQPAHQVVDTMLAETNQVLNADVLAQISRKHLSVHEVLTIASMIEREAKRNSERPLIASVIFNRLRQGMKLQIDATVEYALGGVTNLTDADLAVNNPYNTYLYAGLPPGPIANPGIPSIMAVLHPAHSDFLYYVAKYDGSGGHYFAKTYAEQLANEVHSERNWARTQVGQTARPHHQPKS